MKQHLTPQDLESLTPKGKEKLTTYMNRNPITGKAPKSDFQWEVSPSEVNIGQLIEFLRVANGDRDGLTISGMETKHLDADKDPWTVQPFSYPKRSSREYFSENELIDALWSAATEILNA